MGTRLGKWFAGSVRRYTTADPSSVLCFEFRQLVWRVLVDTKSEGLIKEISTNVVLTCLLSLCDRSFFGNLVPFCPLFEDLSIKEREGKRNAHQSLGQAKSFNPPQP